MAPIRVLYLINSLGAGGAERSLAESLPLLDQFDVDPIVICLDRTTEGFEDSLIEAGYDIRFVEGRSMAYRVKLVRATVEQLSPHIVHTAVFDANQVGRLACFRRATVVTSLISTPYDSRRVSEDPNLSTFKLGVVQLIDGISSHTLTSHFHAVSKTAKQAAMRDLHIPDKKITVVYRGRDPERLGVPSSERRKRVRHQLGFDLSQPIIINLGRHEYAKGQKYLIKAAADLKHTHPDAVTVIAGRLGNATKDLHFMVQNEGLENNVTFLGHVEAVGDLLAAADVFVLPSIYEGLPGAVIEAMALGLPIVASDIPQVRELVRDGHGALLVPVGSSHEIAASIRRLLTDKPLRERFGNQNRREFLSQFTIRRYVAELVSLYRSLVPEAGA